MGFVSKGITVRLLAAVVLAAVGARAASATIWLVPGDMSGICTMGTPSCNTIQDAVTAAAASGDEIQVAAGTFPTATINVNKTLTITGAGAASTFVEPTATIGFEIQADGIVIRNLTIRNATHAIRLSTSGIDNTEINAVDLTNNTSRGIEIANTVNDVRVIDCVLTNNGTGIKLSSTSVVDGLTVTGTTFDTHTLAIYQANDGVGPPSSTLKNLFVDNCTFTNNSSTAAVYMEEIQDGVIEDSFFNGTNQRGVLIFKAYTTSGVDARNVIIRRNQLSGMSAQPIEVVVQGQALGGPVDIQENTIAQDVGLLTSNFGMIDIRLGSAFTHSPVNVTDNTVTFTGTLGVATAAYGMVIRGNGPVVTTGNVFDGSGVATGIGTPPISGIYVRSKDASPNFAAIPSGATLTSTCNSITGFANGVSVFDSVGLAYGGLDAGAIVSFAGNSIAGNTAAGFIHGAAPPTIDAENTWWGCAAGPGNPGCDSVTGNVDFTPANNSEPVCVSGVTATPTETATTTATETETATATATASETSTATPTDVATATHTETATITPSVAAPSTATPTASPGPVITCGAVPLGSCRTPGKSILVIKNNATDAKDKIIWKWLKGADTPMSAVDDPTTTNSYAFCVYDGAAAVLVNASIPAGADWTTLGSSGFKYSKKDGLPNGIVKAIVKSGAAGKSKIIVKGKGANLPDPTLPLVHPITVQMVNGEGECFTKTFTVTGNEKNTSTLFKDKE